VSNIDLKTLAEDIARAINEEVVYYKKATDLLGKSYSVIPMHGIALHELKKVVSLIGSIMAKYDSSFDYKSFKDACLRS